MSDMEALYSTLDRRVRPEGVAKMIVGLPGIEFTEPEKALLQHAAEYVFVEDEYEYVSTSMAEDFKRPAGMGHALEVAKHFFPATVSGESGEDDVGRFLAMAGHEIRKQPSENSFKHDRLNREEREAEGIGGMSKRQYNKRFRLLVRMGKKRERLANEWRKRGYEMMAKSGLASKIGFEQFCSDPATACFVAYYVSKCNVRSVFTVASQERPMDEIGDMLLRRCLNGTNTNWMAIAHAMPTLRVLSRLTDGQRAKLLSLWHESLKDLADFVGQVWRANDFNRRTMIVRKGNDSSTWNSVAGAWNRCRDGWINVLHCMGMEDILEASCPGKVMRLMAGDVAYWHQSTGDDWMDGNTKVWGELPFPWEVVSGEKECSRRMVEDACRKHGLDPYKSGWLAPKADAKVAKFKPTPELVHGIEVGSPALAAVLRKAGIFSGKGTRVTDDVLVDEVDDVCAEHRKKQESKKVGEGVENDSGTGYDRA